MDFALVVGDWGQSRYIVPRRGDWGQSRYIVLRMGDWDNRATLCRAEAIGDNRPTLCFAWAIGTIAPHLGPKLDYGRLARYCQRVTSIFIWHYRGHVVEARKLVNGRNNDLGIEGVLPG